MTKTRIFFVALLAVILAVCIAASWPPAPIQALPGVFADGANGLNSPTGVIQGKQLDSNGVVAVGFGSVIASAATIAPTNGIQHVSGTTQINTITVPTMVNGSAFVGCVVLVPDGLWSTGTSGNISLASTAVVNKALTECYDGTKWNPSY